MALAATCVFEVRTTGSDLNGGAFKAGATGTDRSQQDAAHASGTDLVVDGSDNTKVTSATHNFVAADVGNTIQIVNGGAWTGGVYEIVSVASNAAVLDRSPAATGSTSGTWKLGGAKASLGGCGVSMAGQNQIVSINRGARDGIDLGTVLELYRFGGVITDRTDTKDKIKLPNEKYGNLFIFRVFNRISYGLIMDVTDTAQVGDVARSPE